MLTHGNTLRQSTDTKQFSGARSVGLLHLKAPSYVFSSVRANLSYLLSIVNHLNSLFEARS